MPTYGVQEHELRKANAESPIRSNNIVKPTYINNVKLHTQQHNDFKNTYGQIFTSKSSVIDLQVKSGQNQMYDKFKKDQMEHHKINLLSPNYREMYDMSGGGKDGPEAPQNNSNVPQKSSVNDKDYQFTGQNLAMNANRGKNKGTGNLFSQGISQKTQSLLENNKQLNQSFEMVNAASEVKKNLNNVSLKLGYDNDVRSHSFANSIPRNSTVKEDLVKNKAVYKSNKLKSFDSSALFQQSGNSTILHNNNPGFKGIYNTRNLNNKPTTRNDLSTNSQTYKWTIPKYEL